MITALRVVLVAVITTATSALADGTDRAVFALAEDAIQKRSHGQKEESERAFREFSEAWQIASTQSSYNKTLNVKAAECFLAFGQPTNAIALLNEVLEKTGRSLPPEVPYLLVKSLSQNGESQATIKTLEEHRGHLGGLSSGQRQELMMIGAKAARRLDDIERAKKFLKEAMSIAPETQAGKDAKQELGHLEQERPTGK